MCSSRARDWLINMYPPKLNFRMLLVKGLFVLLLTGKFCKTRWKESPLRFGRAWKVWPFHWLLCVNLFCLCQKRKGCFWQVKWILGIPETEEGWIMMLVNRSYHRVYCCRILSYFLAKFNILVPSVSFCWLSVRACRENFLIFVEWCYIKSKGSQFLLLNKTLVSKHCFWQLKLVQVLNFRYHIFFTLYYLAISYIILLAFASLFIIRANFINKTQECFDNKPVSIYMEKLEKSIYLSKNIRFLMLKHPL